MGLIKAVADTAFSLIGNLWEDYIYCDALDNNTLIKKGRKKSSGGAGKYADDDVITDGSRIAVNAGQMLIVVENGRIVDFTAEQGGYEYHTGTRPSMFCGDYGDGLKITFDELKNRFSFGGAASDDQRVYFVNTKEIMDNRFGFGNVPYRDGEFGITVLMQGFGVYSFQICDPLKFFAVVSGNVSSTFAKENLLHQMKAEIQNEMLPVLGRLAEENVTYDQLPLKTESVLRLLRSQLGKKWKNERGIELKTMTFSSILPDDESIDKIRQLQESRVYSGSKSMLGARVGAAQANAMESAAENPSGAVNGFVGMGMAQNSGGVNVNDLMRDQPKPQSSAEQWTCSCGRVNDMAFCPACGSKKPSPIICPNCSYQMPREISGLNFCPSCGQRLR